MRSILGLCFVSGLFIFLPTASVQALGVSPPRIEVKSVLRGTSQTKKLQLVRLPSEQGELKVDVETFGPYASFLKAPSMIIIPSDQDEYLLPFDIVIPQDAANGIYNAGFRFFLNTILQASEKSGASMGVRKGVQAEVRFTVGGDQVVMYEISNLSIFATEVGVPVRLSFNVSNQGNVVWQPAAIDLQFIDVTDATHAVSATIPGIEVPSIRPGANAELVELATLVNLSEGHYEGVARIMNQDGKGVVLKTQSFSVYPEGTLAQAGELSSLSTNKQTYISGEKVKLEAKFKNTGQIGVKAVLITDITKGDSVLDMVRSDEFFIEKGREFVFSQLLPIDSAGVYALSSYIKYGNHQTEKRVIEIRVQYSPLLTWGVLGLLFFGIGCIIVLKRRGAMKKNSS